MADRSPVRPGTPRLVLTVDIGGSHLKVLASGKRARRSVDSGPDMTPEAAVAAARELAGDWEYHMVSIGYPGPVVGNRPSLEPRNLGSGWVGFDFEQAFGCPVKVINDALLQAIGSYAGGRMLFLGLGTGLGSALVLDHFAHPLELAHLPYRDGRTFEDDLGARGLKRLGTRKWRRRVGDVVARLRAALLVDYVVLGGGNIRRIDEVPEGARRGRNEDAFRGGFRLWEPDGIRL